MTSAMRSRRGLVTAVAVVASLLMGATLAAATPFSDVSDNSVHAPGVTYVADAGITTGCGDGSTYCPGDFLRRDQMATFLHRLSGNAPGIDPTVNAHRLEGFSAAELMAGGEQGPPGPEGPEGPEGPQGAPGEALSRFAVVDANGTLARGSGVVSAELLPGVPDGRYAVVFEDDISECASVATVGRPGVNINPPIGFAMVANWQDDPDNGVIVFVKDQDGAGAERGFHLMVVCP